MAPYLAYCHYSSLKQKQRDTKLLRNVNNNLKSAEQDPEVALLVWSLPVAL
jgi:hypothetical protein